MKTNCPADANTPFTTPAVQLERAVAALGYVVNECRDDIEGLCSGVEAGEGRLEKCLKKNEAKVSDRCKSALKEVGIW